MNRMDGVTTVAYMPRYDEGLFLSRTVTISLISVLEYPWKLYFSIPNASIITLQQSAWLSDPLTLFPLSGCCIHWIFQDKVVIMEQFIGCHQHSKAWLYHKISETTVSMPALKEVGWTCKEKRARRGYISSIWHEDCLVATKRGVFFEIIDAGCKQRIICAWDRNQRLERRQGIKIAKEKHTFLQTSFALVPTSSSMGIAPLSF